MFVNKKLEMFFEWKRRPISWKGCSWVDNEPFTTKQFRHLMENNIEAHMFHLESEEKDFGKGHEENQPEIVELVKEFSDKFVELFGLPLQRIEDHFIHLEPNSHVFTIRPHTT